MHLGVVRGDGLADPLEHGGLASLRGAHDEAALTFTDGGYEIDGPSRYGILAAFHDKTLVGKDGREVTEARTLPQLVERATVDRLDLLKGWILAVVGAGRTNRSLDPVTGSQPVLADELLVYEGVVVTRHVVAGTQEGVTLVLDVQHALDRPEALCTCGGLIDGLHERRLLEAHILDTKLGRLAPELSHPHGREFLAREAGLKALFLLVATVTAIAAAPTLVTASVAVCVGIGVCATVGVIAGTAARSCVILALTPAAPLTSSLAPLVLGLGLSLLQRSLSGNVLGVNTSLAGLCPIVLLKGRRARPLLAVPLGCCLGYVRVGLGKGGYRRLMDDRRCLRRLLRHPSHRVDIQGNLLAFAFDLTGATTAPLRRWLCYLDLGRGALFRFAYTAIGCGWRRMSRADLAPSGHRSNDPGK